MDDAVEGFSDNTRIIYEMSIQTELDLGVGTEDSLTKEPFTVYISGIDTYGEVTETSRSDVNIIAVVNRRRIRSAYHYTSRLLCTVVRTRCPARGNGQAYSCRRIRN